MAENRYISTNLQPRRKTVRMVFRRDELLYDIKNYCYVEGEVAQEDGTCSRHQTQDIGEAGNIDRVTKVLDLAHAECVEALFPYTKQDVGIKTEVDDLPSVVYDENGNAVKSVELPEKELHKDYEISLLVPDAYSQTTVTLLVRLVHEYMVCRVVADWMSITRPEKAALWREKAEEGLDAMKKAVHFRTVRVRRTQTPF